MSKSKLSRIFRSVSFREAGKLHELLRAGSMSEDTRNLLRQAIRKAGAASN